MSFSITNNSATAVITGISTQSSTYGVFTVTSGTFPLLSGDTISGTNTEINNEKGSPYGTIQLFILNGDAQLEIYINNVLYSAKSYSSGIADIQVPILSSGDTMEVRVDEADLPSPSPTPSITPSNTPTPSPTPTPSSTPAPTPTPSATPGSVTPASLGALFYVDITDSNNLNISGGTNYIIGIKNLISGNFDFNALSPEEPDQEYITDGFDTGKGAMSLSGSPFISTGITTQFSSHTVFVITKISADENTGLYSPTNSGGAIGIKQYFATNDNLQNQVKYSTAGSLTVLGDSYSRGNWDIIMFRNYQSDSDVIGETWINGVLTYSGTGASKTLLTYSVPGHALANTFSSTQTNTNMMAAAVMFGYKLSDVESSEIYDYLNSKY